MTTAINNLDFPRAEITALSDEVTMIDYPAFTYLHATTKMKPLSVDKGGRHLGKPSPGVAVAFPSIRHGMLHKHFGLGIFEKDDTHGNKAGEVYAYGKGACITEGDQAKEILVAAFIGDTVTYNGSDYVIEKTSNQNIKLVALKVIQKASES